MIGFSKLLLILLIATLVFGVRRLPEIGAGLGKAIKNLRPILAGTAREPIFQQHYDGADIGIDNLTAAYCGK